MISGQVPTGAPAAAAAAVPFAFPASTSQDFHIPSTQQGALPKKLRFSMPRYLSSCAPLLLCFFFFFFPRPQTIPLIKIYVCFNICRGGKDNTKLIITLHTNLPKNDIVVELYNHDLSKRLQSDIFRYDVTEGILKETLLSVCEGVFFTSTC